MTIKELIEKISEKENVNIADFIEIKEYLPFEYKKDIINEILSKYIDENHPIFDVRYTDIKAEFEMCMIKEHTNLKIRDKDYDALCRYIYNNKCLKDELISLFGRDYIICEKMLEDEMSFIKNKYSIEASIYNLCSAITEKFNTIAGNISNVI